MLLLCSLAKCCWKSMSKHVWDWDSKVSLGQLWVDNYWQVASPFRDSLFSFLKWGYVIVHIAHKVIIKSKFFIQLWYLTLSLQFSSVHSLCRVQLFAIPSTAAHQASLSFIIPQSLLKFMSIESVMPSNHLILCHLLLLLRDII